MSLSKLVRIESEIENLSDVQAILKWHLPFHFKSQKQIANKNPKKFRILTHKFS